MVGPQPLRLLKKPGPHVVEAKFIERQGAEQVRLSQSGTLLSNMQRSPSIRFKLARTVGLGLVHRVRTRQRILLGKAVVASNIEFVGCVLAAGREVKRPAGGIGQRVKGQIVQRLLSQPVLRNDIAGERIADGLAGRLGSLRIVAGSFSGAVREEKSPPRIAADGTAVLKVCARRMRVPS